MITYGLGFAVLVVAVVGLAIFQSKRHAEAPPSTSTLNMSGK